MTLLQQHQTKTPLRTKTSQLLASLYLFVALTTLSALVKAQEQEERWFQIEMIVFSQGGSPFTNEEIWRHDIELNYPQDWRELLDAEALAIRQQEALDALNTNSEGLPRKIPNEEVSLVKEVPTEKDDELEIAETLDPHTLLLLEKEEHSLKAHAGQLTRSNRYRVLFHGAWRQALLARDKAPSIIIHGGDAYDSHYQLEGSVKFSVERYLHVETNLWLTDFSTNFGQERKPWPDLPLPPNKKIDVNDIQFIDDRGTGFWNRFQNDLPGNEFDKILSRNYIVNNIVLMKQKQSRAMRSTELHYLDNPQLGVLVKIIPYKKPEEPDTNNLATTN